MVQATSCPDAPALRRFLLGQTGEEESAPLEAHLLQCDHCLGAVRTLPADDPLISALQQGQASVTPAPGGEMLEKLRLRLREMEPASRGMDTATGENTEAAVPSPSPFEASAEPGPSLAPPQQPDEIGRLGGYRVLKELGRGGMGVVYQAEDPKLKRLVALKVMLPRLAADAGARQRFLREAQAMAAVHHDHVATVFQVDEDRGVPFLAMEFLQGMPLNQWLKEGRKPSIAQVLRMGREIAEGLAAAHERGLIHRDVKPGNIWLDSAHKGRVKILDFGLARVGTEDVHLTRTGAIVGTPAYMSPEQARGEKVDARSDLFSLGCVLYRLCTGTMPFAGDTTTSLLMALALDHPRPVRDLNPDMPPDLSDLVMKLLDKDPARRPASAREVVQVIQALERQPARKQDAGDRTEALPAAPRPAPAPHTAPRRRRLALAVAALVVLGGVIAVGTAALIRIQTPLGDYVIDTDDPDFFFQVHDGTVHLQDRKNNKNYTLKVVKPDKGSGESEVEVSDGGDLAFRTKTFTIKRGETAALTAWFEPKSVAANPQPTKLDDTWLKHVAALPAEKQVEAVAAKLKELNPGFDGKVTPNTTGDGVVEGLHFLADNITDISPVKALPRLRTFTCNGSPGVIAPLVDLSPLKGMPLEDLNISGTHVSDLSPLKDMKLRLLLCSYTRVSDLSPLHGMPLICMQFGFTRVSDLLPLKGMPLEALWYPGTPVSDLSPLRGLPLKGLTCGFKPDRDAEILRSIKTLETINGKPVAEFWKEVAAKPFPPLDEAWVQKVQDLSLEKQVEEVAAELKRRNPGFDGKMQSYFEYNAVKALTLKTDDVADLTPLRALPRLTILSVCGINRANCRLSDLSPLKDMKLTILACNDTRVSDLSPLKGMPLTEVNCINTRVSDLSPLKDMKLTIFRCGRSQVSDLSALRGASLTTLECPLLPITDLSPLKGMPLTFLNIQDTAITDLSPLKGMPLTFLNFQGTTITDLSPLRGMPLTFLNFATFKPERDAELLRSIKPLETINGKPAAEFWKDVDSKKP